MIDANVVLLDVGISGIEVVSFEETYRFEGCRTTLIIFFFVCFPSKLTAAMSEFSKSRRKTLKS